MTRSLLARVYRRLPGWLKLRLSPLVLRYRARQDARRAADEKPEETWESQRLLFGGGDLRPVRYFPGGVQNPYLRLLYGGLPEAGFEAEPLGHYEMLDRLPGSAVFHLHWTRVFQVGSASEAEARAQTAAYLARLEAFLERGGRLVWSVHEALPHDCEFPTVEIELRRRLVELADVVHVLHPSTVGEVEAMYPLDPDRTLVVEHPLYTGVYPDHITRESARRWVGLEPEEVLLLAFGAIRPYKGFDRLVEAVPQIRERTGLPIRVILAGPTFKSIDLGPLQDLVEGTPGVSMTDRAVPDEYVQVLFRAADVAVLPYRQVLNSGVLMLALTFGCPAVAPQNPVTADAVDSGLVHLFDRRSDSSLVEAVVEAVGRRASRGTVPEAYADRYDPREIAQRFAAEIGRRLGGASEPHSERP